MAAARFLIVFYCIFLCLLSGCARQQSKGKSGYFSINEFILDQHKMLLGQPLILRQVTTLNGKTDSNFTDIAVTDWSPIYTMFAATDISDGKYAGQYSFSDFDDATLGVRANTYEAIDPKLFTRRLQFVTDPETNRIQSVYIETADETAARRRWQKLYYAPHQLLQIEEHESPLLGKARNLRVEYRFEY